MPACLPAVVRLGPAALALLTAPPALAQGLETVGRGPAWGWGSFGFGVGLALALAALAVAGNRPPPRRRV